MTRRHDSRHNFIPTSKLFHGMIRAEILTIGSELLQGKASNTNSRYLSEQLTQLGFRVEFHTSCDDKIERIVECLRTAFQRANLILVTGGLGPTPDDITREAVAKFFNAKLKFHSGQYRQILRYFRKLRKQAAPAVRREAFFPANGVPLLNRFGVALGFSIRARGKLLVVLPGVPREMENLFESKVRKLVNRVFGRQKKLHSLIASVAGMDEAEMMKHLGGNFFAGRDFEFGSYPMNGRIVLRLSAGNEKLIRMLRRKLVRKLGNYIYAWSEEPFEASVGRLLAKRKLTVSVAESCSGGLLAKLITDVPGASRYFWGGVITYADRVKKKVLLVPDQILKKHGAVSKQTVRTMARNARSVFETDLAVAITGIAGPGGGSARKPIGSVWIALATPAGERVHRFYFAGERRRIRARAARSALWMLYRYLVP